MTMIEMQDVDAYLESILDIDKRAMVRGWFAETERVFDLIDKSIGAEISHPEIRIKHSGVIQAEASPYVIYIDSSLIEYCLHIEPISFNKLLVLNQAMWLYQPTHINSLLNKSFIESDEEKPDVKKMFFVWIISHEYSHLVRKHTAIELSSFDNQLLVVSATELDADRCATVAVFRYIAIYFGQIYDEFQIKFLVVYSLFWGIRFLAEDLDCRDHPPFVNRFFEIIYKTSHLKISGKNDFNFENIETQEILNELSKSTIIFEVILQQMHKNLKKNFISELVDYLGRSNRDVDKKWDEIKPTISKVSQTPT